MSQIKLGNIQSRHSREGSSFLILSEIIDTGMSYKIPKLIKNITEFDIYFGRSCPLRSYYRELLNQGVNLYLYRPTNPEIVKDQDGYIDYESFDKQIRLIAEVEEKKELREVEVNYLSHNLPTDENGNPAGESGILYMNDQDSSEGPWIWLDGEFVDVNNLEQNLNPIVLSKSYGNRDSLRLFTKNSEYTSQLGYTRPQYFSKNDFNQFFSAEDPSFEYKSLRLKNTLFKNGLQGIEEGEQCISLTVKFPRTVNLYPENENFKYLVLNIGDESFQFWFDPSEVYDSKNTPPLGSDYVESENVQRILLKFETDGTFNEERLTDSIVQELIKRLSELTIYDEKEDLVGFSVTDNSDSENYILNLYSYAVSNVGHFYNIKGLTTELNYQETFDIITSFTNSDRRIDFYSKTIGKTPDLEGDIKISISSIRNKLGWYRVEVSRYDYIEYFEGSLFSNSRLDNIINRESELIECKVYPIDGNGNAYKEDESSLIPEGTWYLKGSYKEEYSRKFWWNSLNQFQNLDTKEDFFLIPDITPYLSSETISRPENYYPEYKQILNYATNKNCQVLIENNNTGYIQVITKSLPQNTDDFLNKKIIFQVTNDGGATSIYYELDNEGNWINVSNNPTKTDPLRNNCIYNLIEPDNRLIYFFDQIYYSNQKRPGYYIFLDQILQNNYSLRPTNDLLYYPPAKEHFLENPSLVKLLESYKSNYLVTNNIYYYYNKLLNHSGDNKYSTSITTRFIVSKISREFENNKGDLIGEKLIFSAKKKAQTIIDTIKFRCSQLVRNIEIVKFQKEEASRTVYITVQVQFVELIDKDITLNIILNYNS